MVIDPESSLGIGLWGYPEKIEVLAECQGCRITRKVKDTDVKIKITGQGGHGSGPHKLRDPITAAS